ncbi:unnamed protein product, partial [Caenorhabditis brenneri]
MTQESIDGIYYLNLVEPSFFDVTRGRGSVPAALSAPTVSTTSGGRSGGRGRGAQRGSQPTALPASSASSAPSTSGRGTPRPRPRLADVAVAVVFNVELSQLLDLLLHQPHRLL